MFYVFILFIEFLFQTFKKSKSTLDLISIALWKAEYQYLSHISINET